MKPFIAERAHRCAPQSRMMASIAARSGARSGVGSGAGTGLGCCRSMGVHQVSHRRPDRGPAPAPHRRGRRSAPGAAVATAPYVAQFGPSRSGTAAGGSAEFPSAGPVEFGEVRVAALVQ